MKILRLLLNKILTCRHRYLIYYWTRQLKHCAQCFGDNLYVGGKSYFSGKIYLGNNCNFNGMTIQGNGDVRIGNNFHSGIQCMIITQNHDYDDGDAIPYGTGYHYTKVNIEDNVWLGNRVTITGNVTIGEGAIVAAASLVCKDVPPFAIVGGNPAKILKFRDINHYQTLKKENKFH